MAFAQNEEIYTSSHALGRFTVRKNQISDTFRDEYNKEINQAIDLDKRRQSLLSINSENFYRLKLETFYPNTKIEINKTNDIIGWLSYRRGRIIEQQNAIGKNK